MILPLLETHGFRCVLIGFFYKHMLSFMSNAFILIGA